MKKRNIILITFGVIMFLGFILSNEESENNVKKEENISIPKETIIYERLETQLNVLKIIHEQNGFTGSRTKHKTFFDYINESKKMLEESKTFQIDSIKTKHIELSTYLTKIQKETFPKIRKEYFLDIKERMWLENIKVTSIGTGTSRLHFEGGLFASNRNKQDFQNLIDSTIKDYRFKRVYYKWYEYDENGIYYTINSKEDGEL